MGSSDKIESAISEIRAQKIKAIDAIGNYLINKNFSLERQTEFYKKLQDNYDNEYTSVVTRWISKNMKTLIDREPRALISILESRAKRGYLDNICLDSQKLNIDDLIKMDKLTKDAERKEIKMINGCILGEIGTRDNEYFIQALTRISDTDEEKKISFLRAISIVSNKFRNPNFVPTEQLRTFIIECTKSSNKELSRHGIFDSIALFEYDMRFKDVISEYFHESEKNRIDVYEALNIHDLRDQDFELSLLGAKGSESAEEIKILMWVLGSKIFRSRHLPDSYIDRSKLQSCALDFIHKVFLRCDIQLQQFFSSSIFTEIGNMDVGEAFRYLVTWLTNEPFDPTKHENVYPRLINEFFKDHEIQLVMILSILSAQKEDFATLIAYTVKEMIFAMNLKLTSYFIHHNRTTVPDLRRLINDPALSLQIMELPAEKLDDLKPKMLDTVKVIERYDADESDPNFSNLRSLRKQLQDKIEYLTRKVDLLEKCEERLVDICKTRQIYSEKLTKHYQSRLIRDIMKRCEILRGELTNTKRKNIKYDDVKLPSFPNIEKHLGQKWLKKQCNEGHPYHHIVLWLSIMVEKKELDQLILECTTECDAYIKEAKSRRLRRILWALAWLNHTDECLGYFASGKEQGKTIVVNGLMDQSNFFPCLTQVEIALRLKQHGYKVDLEVKSDGGRIDILAIKGPLEKIFELYTFDEYAELKYSGFSGNVPDRARYMLFKKIEEQISLYAKSRPGPMFIVFNLTNAHDIDMFGVDYALHGRNIPHFDFDGDEIVEGFTSFQTDQEFLNLHDGKKLTAVITFSNDFDGASIKSEGKVRLNDTAEIKLSESDVSEISRELFD